MKNSVQIVGGGLAGSEAAYQLSKRGIAVDLFEMRPSQTTPAHHTSNFGELVCSNSMKSKDAYSAPGILKGELTRADSIILKTALEAEIPGGQALTIDREVFSSLLTNKIEKLPGVTIHRMNCKIPDSDRPVLIAAGPLASLELTDWIQKISGTQDLYFYDAIAPVVDTDSLDHDKIFLANRYGKGGEDAYLNCPFTKDEYIEFVKELRAGEKVTPKNFEKEILFQGCQPVESIAESGPESLRFGPMKPVGLTDPKSGMRPYAVVQLRPENHSKTAYNLVGFQTKLKYPEQQRIFRKIPGLEKAVFSRLGSIHRNTYIRSPRLLAQDLRLRSTEGMYFFAGQITGVEGYLESAASGLWTALRISTEFSKRGWKNPPPTTAMGALIRYLLTDKDPFAPANTTFSLFEHADFEELRNAPPKLLRDKDSVRQKMAAQGIYDFKSWIADHDV